MKVKEMHFLMKRIEELEAKNDLLRKRTEENDLLRKRTEELEAINDCVAKRNEELQARNDNLTKQNKELQARNDCLTKGNEELQAKNDNLHKNMADEGDCSSEGEKSKSSDELGLESSNNDESHSSGTDDDNNNDEDGSDSSESTSTESVKFRTQFSMTKLTKLICGLTKPQKDLICQCGFGSILDLKCSTMPHKKLILWLATYYDEETQCIKIPGTRAFKLDALTVHWILGIPYGGDKIELKASQDVKYLIANDTTRGRLAPKIEDLIAMITPELVGDRFVRIFMLVVLSIFLCPSSSPRASSLYYEGIRSVKKIKSYDWCDAVMSSLKSGLSNFQKNAGKGNVSGTVTLSGCIFVLFTAYFDYLGTKMNIVPQTIPRIGAWTDEFVHQYMQLDPQFKKMKIKTVGCTVFAKAFLNESSRRGSCFDALNESPCAANVTGPSQQKPSKEVKMSTKGPSCTLVQIDVQIDRDSVQRLISECTDSGFRVFSGEELHPEVDKYIRYVAGIECSNEVLVHLRSLCQSFFKDSFREYILSVEPDIVTQCCALVRSYMSGLQQSSTQKVSPSPSKDIDGSQNMLIHTNKTVDGSSNGKDRDGRLKIANSR